MLTEIVSNPTVDPSTPDMTLGSARKFTSSHDKGVAVATKVDCRLPEGIERRFRRRVLNSIVCPKITVNDGHSMRFHLPVRLGRYRGFSGKTVRESQPRFGAYSD